MMSSMPKRRRLNDTQKSRCKGICATGAQCKRSLVDKYCHHHISQASTWTSIRPDISPSKAYQISARHPYVSHNLPNSEAPSTNLLANARKGGNSGKSAEEQPENASANFREEGYVSGASQPARTPHLSENIVSCKAQVTSKMNTSQKYISTPFNAVSGSSIDDEARARMYPMASDLAHRSYVSSGLLDAFLKGTPEVMQKHADDLCKKDEWKNFIATCTGGEKDGVPTPRSSVSNEKEFRMLVHCIANLEGLAKHFRKPRGSTRNESEINNPRRGHVRLSQQGNIPMKTWNPNAKWLRGDSASTKRKLELKPDLMTVVVEDAGPQAIRLTKPQTIVPPPDDWKPAQMGDKCFPIAECKEPVWECLDLFWECKRNCQELVKTEVYLNCALKAAEALRYQWSRRYVYCFLHCGSKMQLLHYDRSGLVASEVLDIEGDTVKFIQCLLGAFWHKPSRLGYPAGMEAPFHRHDSDDRLRQVVTVDGRQLYIDYQEAGPPRDHLVSRATVTFKAKLVNPIGGEKTGWDWCYKSSWPQNLRKHEGAYLERLQDLPNVVEMLAYSVVKIENNNDDTSFGRGGCSSGEPMTQINTYYNKKIRFPQHTGTTTSAHKDEKIVPSDPRQPEIGSKQVCDTREHRDIVTGWISSSFDEAVSSSDSLSTTYSIWEQAFSAIKAISEKNIVHRDISFRNIRIDDQHRVKVCDFDMAMSLDDESTGAQDRTGTIAFMAVSILSSTPYVHQPIHDCESILWLCALELLPRTGIEYIQDKLEYIIDFRDLRSVWAAKAALVITLVEHFDREESWPKALEFPRNPNDKPLFFCLTALMKLFADNKFVTGYQKATSEFKSRCFDRCIEVIRESAARGFTGMTHSDHGMGEGRD